MRETVTETGAGIFKEHDEMNCCESCQNSTDNSYTEQGEIWCDDCWPCHTCHGEQWGIIGGDWESEDPINGPYEGDIERCPNCGGTGKEKDCTYW